MFYDSNFVAKYIYQRSGKQRMTSAARREAGELWEWTSPSQWTLITCWLAFWLSKLTEGKKPLSDLISFLNYVLNFIFVCVHMCCRTYVSCLLSPYDSGMNFSPQAWQPVPLPTEPSHWPKCLNLNVTLSLCE